MTLRKLVVASVKMTSNKRNSSSDQFGFVDTVMVDIYVNLLRDEQQRRSLIQ